MFSLKNTFNRARLRYTAATRGLGFAQDINRHLYRRYIGHNKIIAWHRGCPVYTTFSPMSMSSVFANKTATFILAGLQNRPHPHMVNIALTDKCNSNCAHCSFYSGEGKQRNSYSESGDRRLMTTQEIKSAIDQSLDLGAAVFNFVGGEPLLRDDIFEIISHIDPDRAICNLFTNGWHLSEHVNNLRKAGLASVRVSIDSAEPSVHDKKRNHPGLFERAIRGIRAAKDAGMMTTVSCTLTQREIEDGELAKIIHLGKRIGINEIIVFDVLRTGRAKGSTDDTDTERIMEIIKPFNEDLSYPGIIAYPYLRSHKSIGCAGGTSYFYISPYGDISPCDFCHENFGNIRQDPLHKIWHRLSARSGQQYGCRIQEH